MTVNSQTNDSNPGFVRNLIRDEGVQRSLAGVFVAVVVMGARKLLFRV